MSNFNHLFLISAPSGSGKTVIMRKVMNNEIISFTTREKRSGEVDGKDYNFITVDAFYNMKENNELAEHTCYSNNYYGLTMHEIEGKLNKGNAFVIVDVHGMHQLKEIYPYTTSIFIMTKKEDAMKFMLERGDSLSKIKQRLETFDQEQENRSLYDYVVKNEYGMMENTVAIVKAIVNTKPIRDFSWYDMKDLTNDR